MPKVSVIVPNYNHAHFLKQRLDSIFFQTFRDFEVIILDDCSSDNSRDVIEEYRSNPLVSHIVYNERNSGSPFKQWAKGFNLAKGEYIWIAESDDWAELNFLETLLPILDSHKTLSLAFCNSHWFSPTLNKHSDIFSKDCFIKGNKFFSQYMATHNSICNASCVLFKKSLISEINPDYQTFFGCGDWLFWIELSWRGDVFYTTKILNHFRQFGNRASDKNNLSGNAYKEHLKILQYLQKKRKLTFFQRHCIAVFYITFEKKYPSIYKFDPILFQQASNAWRKEILSPVISILYIDCMYLLWLIKSYVYAKFGKNPGSFL